MVCTPQDLKISLHVTQIEFSCNLRTILELSLSAMLTVVRSVLLATNDKTKGLSQEILKEGPYMLPVERIGLYRKGDKEIICVKQVTHKRCRTLKRQIWVEHTYSHCRMDFWAVQNPWVILIVSSLSTITSISIVFVNFYVVESSVTSVFLLEEFNPFQQTLGIFTSPSF